MSSDPQGRVDQAGRWTRALVAAALIVSAAACGAASNANAGRDQCEQTAGAGRCVERGGRWVPIGSINGTTAPPGTAASTSTTTTAQAPPTTTVPTTTSAPVPPTTGLDTARFAGSWSGHSQSLVVDPDGHFSLDVRLYVDCANNPPPCDTFQGNSIISGLRADGRLTSTQDNHASGRVLHTTDPGAVPIGAISLSIDPSSDTLTTEPGSFRLCGPSAPANTCGA